MADFQPVRGTRDFYPPELARRGWLFDVWRRTARAFGFEEYDACVLESEELYVRKAGDEITEQLYRFEDKGGRPLALRPEMTPTLARMILQRRNALTFPLKWFSIPQCFRYERMTRGRKREHYQWNVDIVGQPHAVAEVELLSILITALEAMGLGPGQVRILLNDRRLLNAMLEHLGVPAEVHLPVMVVIDKRDKVSPEALDALLAEQGLTPAQVAGLGEFLRMGSLTEVQARLGDVPAVAELGALLERLEQVGFAGWAAFDVTVVRGLSYYTGTVFELRDAGGRLRAICGGGRYDSLLSAYGGDPIPAVGFGFGDVVILELLADLGLLPEPAPALDFAVVPFGEAQYDAALEVSQRLRRLGYRVTADFSGRKLGRALQREGEAGTRRAVLLMPEEMARGELVVRDLVDRSEVRLATEAFFSGLPSAG